MRYNIALFMPAQANFVDPLRKYTSHTQKIVKIPLIDNICLNILQELNLKFAKTNKRDGPNKIRKGGKKIPKIDMRGDVYSTCNKIMLILTVSI